MEKEKEKDKDKDKVDKGKVSKKESRGKPKNEGKWDVTGGEGLEHVPQELEERRRTCKVVNRGWKVYIWTAPKSLSFIQTHYPSFEQIYISYSHHWQRVQALKYLLLLKYGGVVLDWDTQCEKPMDALVGIGIGLFVGSWEFEGNMTGRGKIDDEVSGGGGVVNRKGVRKGGGWVDRRVIGGRVGHGFFETVAEELGKVKGVGKGKKLGRKSEDGDRFFEGVWERYHAWLGSGTTNNTIQTSLSKIENGKKNKKPGDADSIGWRFPLYTAEQHKRFWAPHLEHSFPTTHQHKQTFANQKSKNKQQSATANNPSYRGDQPQSDYHSVNRPLYGLSLDLDMFVGVQERE
ncbi:hypothetical protein ACMFMG_009349 [Clarireedia jacksonii]